MRNFVAFFAAALALTMSIAHAQPTDGDTLKHAGFLCPLKLTRR